MKFEPHRCNCGCPVVFINDPHSHNPGCACFVPANIHRDEGGSD